MSNKSELGIILEQVRKAKHIKAEDLLHSVGMSRSTYARLISGASVPSVELLMGILNELHIEFVDVWKTMPGADKMVTTRYRTIGKMMVGFYTSGDDSEIMAGLTELKRDADATGEEALELLYRSYMSTYYYLKQDRDQSIKFGDSAMQILSKYDEWSHMELHILGDTFTTDQGALLILVVKRFQDAETGPTTEYDWNWAASTSRYYALVEYGLSHVSYDTLVGCIELIRNHQFGEEDMFEMVFLKLMDCVEMILHGHQEDALANGKQLIDDFEWLHPNNKVQGEWLRECLNLLLNDAWQAEIKAHTPNEGAIR